MLLVCFTGFYFVFTRFSGCGLIYICPLRPPCSNSASMITKTLYMLGHSLCNFIQMPGLQDRELVPSFAACHVMIRIPGTVVHCLAAQRLHYTIRKKEPEAQIAKPTGPTTHLPHSHRPPPRKRPPRHPQLSHQKERRTNFCTALLPRSKGHGNRSQKPIANTDRNSKGPFRGGLIIDALRPAACRAPPSAQPPTPHIHPAHPPASHPPRPPTLSPERKADELLHNTASEEKKSPEPIATANRKHRSQQQRALLGKLKI